MTLYGQHFPSSLRLDLYENCLKPDDVMLECSLIINLKKCQRSKARHKFSQEMKFSILSNKR